MFERKFSCTVKFIEYHNDISDYHAAIYTFFNNLEQNKFKHCIKFKNVKPSANELNHNNFKEVNITIICSDIKSESDFFNFVFQINKLWCQNAQKNEFLKWLEPDPSYLSFPIFETSGNLRANEIGFGTLPRMTDFVQRYHFREVKMSSHSISSVLCLFNHLQKEMTLCISNTHKSDCKLSGEMGHKLTFKYDSIIRILANINSDLPAAELYFQLQHPPFLTTNSSPEQEHSETVPTDRVKVCRAKEMEYCFEKFERTFQLGCSCNNTQCSSKLIGRNFVIKIVSDDKFQCHWNLKNFMIRCSKKTKVCFTSIRTHVLKFEQRVKLKYITNLLKTLPTLDKFNCEYAWNVVQSRSDVILAQVSLENLKYVEELKKEITNSAKLNPSTFAKALYFIADMLDKGLIFDFISILKSTFFYFCNYSEINTPPAGVTYVRRVLITPSRLIFLQPYEHFENRIIRNFNVEFMIRASVQDDDYSKLTYAVQYNSKGEEIMKNVVSSVLLSGITIGSRTYEPLAASTSQLREHGIWMYASDNNSNTAASIRKWMGDFSSINNVAKYMARMGQCLSSTEACVLISIEDENEMKPPLQDIKTRDGRYIFSDGIGMISTELAEEVRHAMLKNSPYSAVYSPVAFQIRYKGCKGMVVENPTIKGRKLGIRPSMKKFNCTTSKQLEIVKISGPTRLYLNKHLITILEQMGVAKEAFLHLEMNMILHLLDSLMDDEVAANQLSQNLSPLFPFRDLQRAGVSLTSDPFFRSLLLAYFKSFADQLRNNMRIAVPEKFGRNMLGVLDETKSLKYGQVFVQYSKSLTDPSAGLEILTGPVIVTKNPSLHPGDVRKLTAIDVPALHHIKDCIVFPAKGRRPHPDEMAGSDLDGDEMVVIWYEPLIFTRENAKPMIYPVYKEEIRDDIQLPDMVNFFCQYIRNDNIGTFAHAHLVWADRLKEGIFSKMCMDIAKCYPYVLDFAKYGTTKYLNKSQRPKQYPDFLQKGIRGNTYHSNHVLGSLYRTSRVLNACSSKINLACQTVLLDPDLEFPGWENYEKSAEFHRCEYTARVIELLDRYGLENEAEAFCGMIELDIVKNWRQDKLNAIKIIRKYLSSIMGYYKNVFLTEVKDEFKNLEVTGDEKLKRKFQRASAWYRAVYGQKTVRVLSFAWIVSDILVDIKKNSVVAKSWNMDNNNASKKMAKSVTSNIDGNLAEVDSSSNESSNVGLGDINSKMNLMNTYNSGMGSFFCDTDCDIRQWCTNLKIDLCSEQCLCNFLLKKISMEWISKSGLNFSKTEGVCCDHCYNRIFAFYESNSDFYCCSGSTIENCTCKYHCSSSKILLHFLKIFITIIPDTSLGQCDNSSCDGFSSKNLQDLSLQTYSYLAVSRNIFYLGLSFETKNFTKNVISVHNYEDMFQEEGDPIKIPVNDDLKEIVEYHSHEMIIYLKKKSGVKDITLTPEKQSMCLIVSSVGRNWQRWNLQEILLDVHFTQNLKKALNI